MGLLSILFGLIDPATRIIEKIAQARLEQTKALTDREKIAADERVALLQAKRDVLIAEAQSPINAIVRACFTFPICVYFAKVILWDKVLSLGRTDDLTANQWTLVWIIIGFYFVQDVTRLVRRK